MKKITFISADGTRLVGVWHLSKKNANKAIVLAHGITVNKDESGVFVELADQLVENGFAVFRFDFRGHGESEGKSVDMTISGEISDLAAAIDLVKQQYDQIGLLGASFGGGISTLYTAGHQNELQALCLWNPVLNYDHCFLNPTLPWIVTRKGHIKNDIKTKGWTKIGSRNFILGKPLFDEMSNLYPYKELIKIKIPTIILHGDKDMHVPYEDSQKYALGICPLITIKNSEHGFHKKQEFDQAAIATILFFKKYFK